jgi:hypothetical protein
VGDKVLAIFTTIWYTEFDQTTGTNNILYDLTFICTCKKEHISGNNFTTDLANDSNLWTTTQLNSDEASKASKDAKGNVIHTTYATKEENSAKMDKFGELSTDEFGYKELNLPGGLRFVSDEIITLRGNAIFLDSDMISLIGNPLRQVGTPEDPNDAATKGYVDNAIGDIDAALDELHAYAQSLINGGATE